MAKARRKESTRPGELAEEVRLRREMARLQAAQVKEARKALATYRAADKGRGNRDWKASPASADAAVIPDAAVLNARARQCVRDSWIGRSAVRAFSRNVVGCGVMPVPLARDAAGAFLPAVNARLLKLFWHWANDKALCDVEKRQTFWQKQNLLVEERVTVGEGFLVWSYAPSDDPAAVGLKLQSFESEQLDLRLQSWHDPATNEVRQVRGGVEVDEWGAAVAYHFYTRNPADYLPVTWRSVRIPAARVFHYFKQERVLQVRGVTQLAPILQDVRDFNRFREATLWRAIMEACIGGIIKTELPGMGASPLSFGQQPGAATTTAGGKRMVDYAPGMVVELAPNESMEPFIPTTPGSQYDPFTKTTLRGIGAGLGLSYGQLARQSEGNYSAARQDMLEDRKEFEPEQEMLAHNVVLPVYQLFARLAAAEGKLDGVVRAPEFAADPARFLECEYVAPAAPWIDPAKEAAAFEKLIELRVIDRDEIAHLRGRRLTDIWDKIQAEQELAKEKGITLPEASPAPQAPAAPPPDDEDDPKDPEDDDAPPAKPARAELKVLQPPHYRDGDAVKCCGTCSFLSGHQCAKFDVPVEDAKVCDAWGAAPVSRNDASSRQRLTPWTPQGERPLDLQFQSDAARRDVGDIGPTA